MSSSYNITALLEKTNDLDKDERYMATSDLCTELQKDVNIDSHLEGRICTAVLKQLDDSSNDVQSIAVKCLGILVTKAHEQQIGDICNKLCDLILDGKGELRDIYSIGLKTLITDVPEAIGATISPKLTKRMIVGIQQEKDIDVKLECIDILSDVLKRFGKHVGSEHENIMETIQKQLFHTRAVVRKRATACLGALGVVLPHPLLNRLIHHLLTGIQGKESKNTLIQSIGTLSRVVGHRLGEHLDVIVPLFLTFCGNAEDETMHTDVADELRENCLQGFESFILRCPHEISKHIKAILAIVMEFIQYDPNYTYVDDDENSNTNMDVTDANDDDEEYSDEELDDFSDDDDTSWKVRRAALRVLVAIITSRPEMLSELYAEAGEQLIRRFKEREENVRIDILACFSELMRATIVGPVDTLHTPPRMSRQRSCVSLLHERIPLIIKASTKQLGQKCSLKSQSAVFSMLRQLAHVVPGSLAQHMGTLLPCMKQTLEDRHSGLKLDTLLLLNQLLSSHKANVFHPYLDELIPIIIHCIEEDWYKIIAEALRVVQNIVQTMRACNDNTYDYKHHVLPLYSVVSKRLSAHDIDQEIKECAIAAMGQILGTLGDHLTQEIPTVLPILVERLQNEITRTATLKALTLLSRSELQLDLSSILNDSVTILTQFLKQQSRPLKQATLDTLNALVVSKTGEGMTDEMFREILDKSSILITDQDLYMCHLALQLIISTMPYSSSTIERNTIDNALVLARSPLLQGPPLHSLLDFFRTYIKMNPSDFQTLLTSMINCDPTVLPKPAIQNLARCVAVLCIHHTIDECMKTVDYFVTKVQTAENEPTKHLALLCLGEIGRQVDLTSKPQVQEWVLHSFESGGEETKSAAAHALGYICVGNMSRYLPVIVTALEKHQTQYLLLSALKEVITCHSNFQPHVATVLPILQQYCECKEEGVRSMVAECLGKLALVDSECIIPWLIESCSPSTSLLTRWTVVTALKFCLVSPLVTQYMIKRMQDFLETLNDEDISVKRAALLSLNSAAHHQPTLIQDHFVSLIFPRLLKLMGLKMERVVDLGPFKHKVDDGLVLRKAAFSCIDTVLSTLPEKLDVPSFMTALAHGLGDHDDVQMLCHQILVKICALNPGAVVNEVEMLLKPLDATVNRKVKDAQVATEVDRTNDLIRNALRAVDAMNCIEDVKSNIKFTEFMDMIERKDKLKKMLAQIMKERTENN